MFDKLRNKFPLDDDKWNEYLSCFKRIEVAARTILLSEGNIAKKVFIIEKGCVRAWFNNEGEDATFQFFFETNLVASAESFKKNIQSYFTIETIEPCILWYIHKKDLDRIIEEIKDVPELRDKFIDGIFERTFDYMKHFLSFIKDTPKKRYLILLEQNPQVLQRIPQHYIASYLGITKVHLSRIKGAIARKK